MSMAECAGTAVVGTNYKIAYAIIEEGGEDDPEELLEYGIHCILYFNGNEVSRKEIRSVSTDYDMVVRMLHKVEKYQVFPVHLRDVVEDLLILEYEERESVIL